MTKLNREQVEARLKAGPKKETGGNSRPDIAWIEQVSKLGELREPDPSTRPPGFLYDVILQWEGYAEELNEDFFEHFRRNKDPKARKCNGSAYVRDQRGGYIVDCEWERLKRPCLVTPALGATVCHSHGARIPAVRQAAQRVLAEASEVVALRLVHLTGTKDELDESIAHKDRIAAANSVLDRAGVKGGVEVEVTTPGYKNVLAAMFEDDPNG
jgi:hypothetical protein